MVADPLGPLTLRWHGLQGMLPWLPRFAAASPPSRVLAGPQARANHPAAAVTTARIIAGLIAGDATGPKLRALGPARFGRHAA